ncbi:MAG: T9SS type A sorting domain-containing protein [candidate division WOR-3 bacterium]|nr:MAG: T9SS type A sorting domain-containing protein [candidate division WOR-3 bacterium]
MFGMFDTSEVVIYAIGAEMHQLQEFVQLFGMRYVGLQDDQGVYGRYAPPMPEAPYPIDYVIDQHGIVRYWSDQYDAQAVIQTIERLLPTGVTEEKVEDARKFELPRSGTTLVRGILALQGTEPARLTDVNGATAKQLVPGENDIRHLAPGVYFIGQDSRVRGSQGPSVRKVVIQR